jgi:DNA-binding YbaB/EbfC family protein
MSRGGGGFGGGGINMAQLRQQAMQMQKKMEMVQEEVGKRTLDIASGGGAVKITITGKLEIVALTIDPAVIKDGDVDMIQDLVKAATNEAVRKAKEMSDTAVNGIMGNMPPGML